MKQLDTLTIIYIVAHSVELVAGTWGFHWQKAYIENMHVSDSLGFQTVAILTFLLVPVLGIFTDLLTALILDCHKNSQLLFNNQSNSLNAEFQNGCSIH